MKLQRYLLGSALCGAMLVAAAPARAELCQVGTVANYRLVGGNPIVIKQNLRPGELIRSIPQTGTGTLMAACSGRTVVDSQYLGLVPSGYPGIYKTSVEGLGIKLEWAPTGGTANTYPHNDVIDQPGRYNLRNDGVFTYSFYRIDGDFTGGVIGAGGAVDIAETRADTLLISRVRLDNVRFTLATCSITTASLFQTVDLGRRTPRDFGADGGSPWVDFKLISDDCDLTQFSDATFTFSGTTVVGAPELFAVTGGAGGVGVQLGTAGGTDIVPGVDLDMPVLAAGGEYGFRARFKRTVDPLVSGRARAEVVVRVDYD